MTRYTLPPGTPWCGMEVHGTHLQGRRYYEALDALAIAIIDELGTADLVQTRLPPEVCGWLPYKAKGFAVEPRITYRLFVPTLQEAWEGLKSNIREAIRNAEKRLCVDELTDPQVLFQMVRATMARENETPGISAEQFVRLYNAVRDRDCGRMLYGRDEAGIHGSVFFVWDDNYVYYLYGASNPVLRKSGVMSRLVWEGIKIATATGRTFDFEGSSIPGIAQFFRSFGAKPVSYFEVSKMSSRFRVMRLLSRVVCSGRRTLRDRLGGRTAPKLY